MLVCMEVETTSQNQLKGGHVNVRSKNCDVAIAIVYVAIKSSTYVQNPRRCHKTQVNC